MPFEFLFLHVLYQYIYVRNLLFESRQLTVKALRLLYVFISGGESCPVCGKITFLMPVCTSCRNKYFSVSRQLSLERCKYCGRVLTGIKDICTTCREERVLTSTDRVMPLFSYRIWNKEIMFRWKMQEERSFSPFFAGLMAKAIRELGESVIVPVPPRKGKIRKKGWDQIDELCSFLKNRYGFRLLKILERKSIEEQKKLTRSERLRHIKTAYSLISGQALDKALKAFSGTLPESVCLIDDVCTTGSTLESCAALLKSAGIGRVNVVTLFTVD